MEAGEWGCRAPPRPTPPSLIFQDELLFLSHEHGTCNRAVYGAQLEEAREGIMKKTSLFLWRNLLMLPKISLLYPCSLPTHLRRAVILRAQLLTSTYPTQRRLVTIGKDSGRRCRLCAHEEEDTLHFLASCPILLEQRLILRSHVCNLDLPPIL